VNLQPTRTDYEIIHVFVLRPEHVTDAYVSWLNDPDVNQFLESRFTKHTLESTRDYVTRTLESPDNLFLGIHSTELARHVGNIKIGPINKQHRTGEVGIMIGDKSAWGRGIGTAAIKAMSEIARTDLGLRKVTAGCYASNGGSQWAFEKAGYMVEGVRRKQFLLDGAEEDLVIMGQLLT
jgi:ribosomal-protein-alanine N-acetyltransferase